MRGWKGFWSAITNIASVGREKMQRVDHLKGAAKSIRNRSTEVAILTIFLFLGTIQFDHPAGIYPYPYIYLALILIGVLHIGMRKIGIKRNRIIIILLLLLFALSNQFQIGLAGMGELGTFLLAVTTAFIFGAVIAPNALQEFSQAIQIILWLFTTTLLIQVAINVGGFGYIDIHNIFFPWSNGKGSEYSFGVSRYTGIHQEPGAHATVVTALLLLHIMLSRSFRLIHILAAISCALTFSAIGLIYFFAVLTISSIRFLEFNAKSILTIGAIVPAGAYSIWLYGAEAYITERFVDRDQDMSLNSRTGNFELWAQWSDYDKLFGRGLDALRSEEFSSLQGSGFLLSSIVCFGILWIIALFGASAALHSRNCNLLSLIIITAFVFASRFPPISVAPFFLLFIAATPMESIKK